MKKSILWILVLTMVIACKQESKHLVDPKYAVNAQYFDLDGFVFGENYEQTSKRIEDHHYKLVDRVEFVDNKEEHKEIYPLVDLMETYEGLMYGESLEIAFHFKENIFQFLVLQSKVSSIESLVELFREIYGEPMMRGASFEGEIFQGDNILWRVYDQDEIEIGYISLMPIEGVKEANDWGAIITIYPYSANPFVE